MDYIPILTTLKISLTATAITFFTGIILAYKVARLKRYKGPVDALIILPMVLPPTVVGFFLLLIFGKRSPIGQFLLQFDVSLAFTWQAAVIAAVTVSLPLMYRATRGAFESLDADIINAARTLGVSERRIFWRIVLPNARHGIMAGLVLSFTRTLGEFGATMMFAGNVPGVTQTMSTAIYSAVQANDYDSAFRQAILLAVISIIFITMSTDIASHIKARSS